MINDTGADNDAQGDESKNYIDFVISGQPLSQLVQPETMDLIGKFGQGATAEHQLSEVEELAGLKPPELSSGRTCFYVCPACGDIGCGAITARVEVGDDIVIWKDFGYETGTSGPSLEHFRHIGPLIFRRAAYLAALEELRQMIRQQQ